jgi:hypothetical protein
MIVSLQNHLKNGVSLGSQLRALLYALHDGFRLILNQGIVKRSNSQVVSWFEISLCNLCVLCVSVVTLTRQRLTTETHL